MKKVLLAVLVLFLSGCDAGFKQLGETEYGLLFRKIPPFLGGGIAESVLQPGQMAFVWPWDRVYVFDTSVKDISLGKAEKGDPASSSDYVYTRALDGNELALAVTVRYQINTQHEALRKLVQNVARSDEEVRELVTSVAKADIRTYMNELLTSQFLAKSPRYEAVDRVRQSMADRLEPLGINIRRVNLDDFRFERLLPSGEVDGSYQDKLKEIQKLREDTERERSRIETVRAKKKQEFNDTQARVNRLVEEAQGYKRQAKVRGDAYYEAHANKAKAILVKGQAEVQGLIERINALAGPGGKAILKLDLAKELLKNQPQFVLLSDGKSGDDSIEVRRVDANELLQQIGAIEAWKETQPTTPSVGESNKERKETTETSNKEKTE